MSETITMLAKLIELNQNARLSRTRLEAKKLRKFRSFVRGLYQRSPYYHQLINQLGIVVQSCVPQDFPVLTKSDIMLHYDRMVTDQSLKLNDLKIFLQHSDNPQQLYRNKYQIVQTSGTTGDFGIFPYSRKDWIRGLAQAMRFMRWTKLFQARRYAYYGTVKGHYMGPSAVLSGFRCKSSNNIIQSFNIDNDKLDTVIEGLNAFQPKVLGSYATALMRLAHEQYKGRLDISPKWIESYAETLSDTDRGFVEKAFGCSLYNLYGSTEAQMMGICKPWTSEMILHDDDLIYEFEDDHLLVTSLINTTLPLIRYRMSDIVKSVSLSDSHPYLVVDSFIGRETAAAATFRNVDGKLDFISSMTLMESRPGLIRFQMRPTSLTSFVFNVFIDETLNSTWEQIIGDTKQWLDSILSGKGMLNVTYEIRKVDSISIDDKTKKFRLIDLSDLPDSCRTMENAA